MIFGNTQIDLLLFLLARFLGLGTEQQWGMRGVALVVSEVPAVRGSAVGRLNTLQKAASCDQVSFWSSASPLFVLLILWNTLPSLEPLVSLFSFKGILFIRFMDFILAQ